MHEQLICENAICIEESDSNINDNTVLVKHS